MGGWAHSALNKTCKMFKINTIRLLNLRGLVNVSC
jgi:hypothetical protein